MPFQVHAHHQVPVFFREADEHAVTQDAGIVDQHMHLAKRRQRGVDDVLRATQGGDIVVVGDGLAAPRVYLVHHRLGRLAADVVDHDIGALGGERQRIGAAQPATGAGDNHGTAFTDCHGSAPVAECWRLQSRSMMLTLAWPPPSHMVCRP
ncbi:hypothetical protein D3C76_1438670 [compost metagenome]